MEMNRKIYEISIGKNKQSLFYIRNGYLTHIEDERYPYQFISSHSWNPETGYDIIVDNNTKIIFPTARIKRKDFKAYIKTCFDDFDNHWTGLDGNFIVLKREIDNEYIDVGVTVYDAITEHEVG